MKLHIILRLRSSAPCVMKSLFRTLFPCVPYNSAVDTEFSGLGEGFDTPVKNREIASDFRALQAKCRLPRPPGRRLRFRDFAGFTDSACREFNSL
jgi:hypothetical protein